MDLLSVPVTLVVKAPSQKFADQTIECPLDWSIKRLKKHLANVYPNKPGEHQQKLVYSGKLLQDDSLLKDVLRQHDDDQSLHTLHLVCSQDGHDSVTVSTASEVNQRKTNEVPNVSSSTPQSDGIRQRTNTNTTSTTFAPSQSQPTFVTQTTPTSHQSYPSYSMYNPVPYTPQQYHSYMMNPNNQIAMMNYWYSQSMTQYMQMYNYQMMQGSVLNTDAAAANARHPAPHQPAAPNAAPRGQRGDQPVAMNAQGGMADDDDFVQGGQRDWLDWLYIGSRLIFMLTLFYLYTPLKQFILLVITMATVFIIRSEFFKRRFGRYLGMGGGGQNGPNRDEDQQRQREEPQQNGEQPEQEGNEDAQNDQTDAAPPAPQEPPRPSILSVVFTFFLTFFTSLIPQNPEQPN